MESTDAIKTRLLDKWLEANRERYKRLTESRRAVANKAQGNIAISGIFIAICFNWIKDIVDAKIMLTCYQSIGLIGATSLFLFSIVMSVFVLRVDEVPESKECELIGMVINAKDKYLLNDIHHLFQDLSNQWKKANDKLDQFNLKKSKQLFLAQATFSVGVMLIGLITLVLIVSSKLEV